jgi:hypothetical protein
MSMGSGYPQSCKLYHPSPPLLLFLLFHLFFTFLVDPLTRQNGHANAPQINATDLERRTIGLCSPSSQFHPLLPPHHRGYLFNELPS